MLIHCMPPTGRSTNSALPHSASPTGSRRWQTPTKREREKLGGDPLRLASNCLARLYKPLANIQGVVANVHQRPDRSPYTVTLHRLVREMRRLSPELRRRSRSSQLLRCASTTRPSQYRLVLRACAPQVDWTEVGSTSGSWCSALAPQRSTSNSDGLRKSFPPS